MSVTVKDCPVCGQLNPATSSFCPVCGASLTSVPSRDDSWRAASRFPPIPASLRPRKYRRPPDEVAGLGWVWLGVVIIFVPILLSASIRAAWLFTLIGAVMIVIGFWQVRRNPDAVGQAGMVTSAFALIILAAIGYRLAGDDSSPRRLRQTPIPTVVARFERTATPPPRNAVMMLGGDAAHTGQHPGPAPIAPVRRIWRVDTAGALYTTPAVSEGLIFTGTKAGFLLAIDEATGEERWRADLGGDIVRSSPAIAGDRVIVALGTTLFCFDAATGAERWTAETPFAGSSSPVVDGAMVVIGFPSGNVSAFDVGSGERSWQMSIDGAVVAAPAISGDRVIVATDSGNVIALGLERGNILWRYDGADGIYGSPVVGDDHIFVSSIGRDGRQLAAIALADGRERWTYSAGGESAPVWVDGMVMIVDSDGGVFAFDARNGGDPIWLTPTGGEAIAAPSVVAGMIYVASGETLFAIDRETGMIAWRYAAGYRLETSPVVVNGRIYVGGEGGYLDALASVMTQPTPTP